MNRDDSKPEEGAGPRRGGEDGSSGAAAARLWAAGREALARAQDEGGKLVERLAQEGRTFHQRSQEVMNDKLSQASAGVTGFAAQASERAATQRDRMDAALDERFAKRLARMGVPTRQEFELLQARVTQLEEDLDRAYEMLDGTASADPGQAASAPSEGVGGEPPPRPV